LWNFLKSIKLTVTLLILLSISSAAGTFIAQTSQTETPLDMIYYPAVIHTFAFLGLFDIYHSWWFALLIMFLFVNLLICTADRLPGYIKRIKSDFRSVTLKNLYNMNNIKKESFDIKDSEETARKIRTGLRGFKEISSNNSEVIFFKLKGKYSPLNTTIVHTGILIIMLGALIGSMFGTEGKMALPENKTKASFTAFVSRGDTLILPLGFAIKCNKFKIEYYQDNPEMPSQYYSEVEILERGRSVKKKTISVNKPLFYKGTNIYQSSYDIWQIFNFKIVWKGKEFLVSTSLREKAEISDPELALIPLRYIENYPGENSKSSGPAVLIHLIENNKMRHPFPVFSEPVNVPMDTSSLKISFIGLKNQNMTILQVTRNPGIPVIWTGFIVLIAGLFLICFYRHERCYIAIEKKSSTLHLFAKTNKLSEAIMNNDFLKIRNFLEKA